MNIVYIAVVSNLKTDIGVIKKINSQIQQYNEIGINVYGYILYEEGEDLTKKEISNYRFIKIKNKNKLPIIRKIVKRRIIADSIKIILKKEKDVNFVYFRYIAAELYLLRLIRMYRGMFVLEHQTMEFPEYISKKLFVPALLEYIFGRKVRRCAAALIGVTDEITKYEVDVCSSSINSITISNGIDIDMVPLRNVPSYSTHTLNMLFVGNVSIWHGLDRLIYGIKNYNGPVNLMVYIAGGGSALSSLIRLVKELELEKKVKFLGKRTGKELDVLFDQATIAIGSLGVHRKNLKQAATLKVREYCARGVPFILSEFDVDICKDDFMKPYYLKIDANDSPVNINDIIEFANNVVKIHNHNTNMRNWASEHIDMNIKAIKLKKFLEKLKEEK